MKRWFVAWLAVTALGCVVILYATRITAQAAPSEAVGRWALATLEAGRKGQPMPPAPADYHAAGPVVTTVWWQGRPHARHVGSVDLVKSVTAARWAFAKDETLAAVPAWLGSLQPPVYFTISVPLGQGPLVRFIPILSGLGLVPLLEGVQAELDGRVAIMTPTDIHAKGWLDRAVVTPIPDLSFGVDLHRILGVLAQDLGVDTDVLIDRARIRRYRAHTISAQAYPLASQEVNAESLELAARQGADFLLRHMRSNGTFTYVYDARKPSRQRFGSYSMPRHGGTTAFLAQAATQLEMPKARRGAIRALRWVRRHALTNCGGEDRKCVHFRNKSDMGAAALTALAAAQVIQDQDNKRVREMLTGLTAFIRSMQRPDGELMHEYDVRKDKPIDVQRMYYSGEAAFAMLHAHRALGDDRDLETVKKLMPYLTGSAWSFFGSRYFYGEEHWTCQAAAEAADRMDATKAIEFCMRWASFQGQVQYTAGQTPWPVAGAYGVGPLIVPRLTAVASRVEAGAHIYRAARDAGLDVSRLRTQIEAALGVLMRMRWAPGPAHLFFDPAAALGGIPATQASLKVRNDYVQHAGSAMLYWARLLREEAEQPAP